MHFSSRFYFIWIGHSLFSFMMNFKMYLNAAFFSADPESTVTNPSKQSLYKYFLSVFPIMRIIVVQVYNSTIQTSYYCISHLLEYSWNSLCEMAIYSWRISLSVYYKKFPASCVYWNTKMRFAGINLREVVVLVQLNEIVLCYWNWVLIFLQWWIHSFRELYARLDFLF